MEKGTRKALRNRWRLCQVYVSSLLEELQIEGSDHCLGSTLYLQFLKNVVEMRFDRAQCKIEFTADLAVRFPRGDQAQDLEFALAQRFDQRLHDG